MSGTVHVINRNEKKAREALMKLGLKKVPGIVRVTFRKKDNQIIAIDSPEVYKSAGGNYVVFGEPRIDDFTRKLAAAQAQAQKSGMLPTDATAAAGNTAQDIQADMQAAADANAAAEGAEKNAAEEDKEGEEEEVDAGDLSKEDIELVMQQANASRAKAIKALKDHNGDIVNAIMSLS